MTVVRPKFNTYEAALAHLMTYRARSREAVVILTRHGQTTFNTAYKLQAWEPDLDTLTPFGIKQAEQLRRATAPLPITWFASSDVQRAVQTARIVAGEGEVTPLKCLRDLDYGTLGGLTFLGKNNQFQTTHPELYDDFKNDRLHFAAPGGERYSDLTARVEEGFAAEILPRSLGGISLLVSHVGWIREFILRKVLGTDINSSKPPIDSTSLTIVHFGRDASPTLLLFNNTDHLTEPQ